MPLCDELPMGNVTHTAPQIKTQYSQYSQYSQSAPPGAAQQTAAAMQNLSAKKITAGVCCAQSYRRGNAGQLDDNGGLLVCARRDACIRLIRLIRPIKYDGGARLRP